MTAKDEPNPSRLERVKNSVDVGKSLFALLRDIAIFLLLLLLLAWPAAIQNRLREAGVKTANLGVVTVEVERAQHESVAAFGEVSDTKASVLNLLHEVEGNPSYAPLAGQIRALAGSLNVAEQHLDRSTRTQEQVIQATNPTVTSPVEGWVSLNFVNVDGPVRAGAIGVTHSRPLTVRAEGSSASAVVTVLPIGSRVEIREKQGNFVRIVQR